MTFRIAYNKTMIHEGGYSKHPFDRGGETYKGIARNYHPEWEGWDIIDKTPDSEQPHVPEHLVQKFYREKYWDEISLTIINNMAPKVSIELFDISVNFGTYRAAKTLQRCINIFNRNERNYDDMVVDGWIGGQTIKALEKYITYNSEESLLKLIMLLKGKYYIDIVENNTSQEVFIRGWLDRVKLKVIN